MPHRPQPPAGPSPLPQPGSGAASALHQNEVLDEALTETFPASDAIAVNISRLDPPDRATRKLPDGRTRDNIEQ